MLVEWCAWLDRRLEGDEERHEDYAEGDDEDGPPGVDPGLLFMRTHLDDFSFSLLSLAEVSGRAQYHLQIQPTDYLTGKQLAVLKRLRAEKVKRTTPIPNDRRIAL